MRTLINGIGTILQRRCGLLAALALGAVLTALAGPDLGSADAQRAGKIAPQATTVGPRIVLDGHLHQSVHQANQCVSTSNCQWRFSRPPAGKHLIVTQVSCSVVVFNGGLKNVGIFSKQGATSVFAEQYLRFDQTLNAPPTYVVSDTTLALIEDGANPIVYMESNDTNNGYNGTCSIAGRLVP